jgi:hypothetical protein
MSDEPTAGLAPRTRPETRPRQKHTRCAVCGGPAVGYDARERAPTCRVCARLRADGGHPPCGPAAATKWFTGERARSLECNAFRRDLLAVAALHGRHAETAERPNGLEIKRAIEVVCDREVHASQLYPALHDLTDADLLCTDPRHQRTHHYIVTDRGQATLAAYAKFLRAAALAAGVPAAAVPTVVQSGEHDLPTVATADSSPGFGGDPR